jgi:integrase
MSRELNQLKDTEVKQAKPKEKQYYLNDGGGLRLQIKPNGSKIWVFRFMLNGSSKETTFKSYPTTTLKEAREKRAEYKKLIDNNINPIDYFNKEKEQQKKEETNSFKNVMYQWLENEKPNAKIEQYEWKKNRFEKDVLPYLKNKKMNDVVIQDIVTVIKAKNKTAPETASKLFGYLKSLFGFAVLNGYCERNLLVEVNKTHLITKRTVKHMAQITDKEVLKELTNSIYSYHGSFSVKNCLRLVLHIPLRAENLCTLKWNQIDFDKKLMTIPRNQMKLKNPNYEDFKMPLSDEVISILKEQKRELILHTNNQDYVFLGFDNNTHINKESPNKALKIMEFNREGRKIRLHGFRGTFRSMIDTLDTKGQFTYEVKERALDHHEKSKVVRAYSHKGDYFEQLQELMTYWSNFIKSLREINEL